MSVFAQIQLDGSITGVSFFLFVLGLRMGWMPLPAAMVWGACAIAALAMLVICQTSKRRLTEPHVFSSLLAGLF